MAEQDINKLKSRKRALEEEVATIEKQIFNLEGAYLEDTWNHGNAVRGWEPYLTNKNKGGNAPMRRQRFKESDRIFSFSSATAEQNVGEQYAIYTEKEPFRERNLMLSTAAEEGGAGDQAGGSGKSAKSRNGKADGRRRR